MAPITPASVKFNMYAPIRVRVLVGGIRSICAAYTVIIKYRRKAHDQSNKYWKFPEIYVRGSQPIDLLLGVPRVPAMMDDPLPVVIEHVIRKYNAWQSIAHKTSFARYLS